MFEVVQLAKGGPYEGRAEADFGRPGMQKEPELVQPPGSTAEVEVEMLRGFV
jgi:hypothetical protein